MLDIGLGKPLPSLCLRVWELRVLPKQAGLQVRFHLCTSQGEIKQIKPITKTLRAFSFVALRTTHYLCLERVLSW